MIPTLESISNCDYRGTKLCYSKENKNSNCFYSNFECSDCQNNASLINGICRCNNNYYGLGYFECIETECVYIKDLMENNILDCCQESGIKCSIPNIIEL